VLPFDAKGKTKTRLFFNYHGLVIWCAGSGNKVSHLLVKHCVRAMADIHRGDGGQYIQKIAEREETSFPPQITEAFIAAMMDKLAEEAHKVQAANPECQFPIGVSAKTAMALGWTDEFYNIIYKIRQNSTLVEDLDYQVCFFTRQC
jgi:hypothetical protein